MYINVRLKCMLSFSLDQYEWSAQCYIYTVLKLLTYCGYSKWCGVQMLVIRMDF